MIIETDPPAERHVPVRDETGTERVEFEVLRTLGEQGGIFDTSGTLADAALVNRARRFICVHKLTGTDAESLAPDDGFARSFCASLGWQRIVVRMTIRIGISLSITVAATRYAASR
jgi:hypothetical protein